VRGKGKPVRIKWGEYNQKTTEKYIDKKKRKRTGKEKKLG